MISDNRWFQRVGRMGLVLFCFLLCFGGVVSQLTAANWTSVVSEQSGRVLRAVTYGNGQYVAVGDRWQAQYGGDDKAYILTSTDGRTWTKRVANTSYHFYGVTYGAGLYVAVGYHGQIFSSPDGITWTQRVAYTTDGSSLTSVAYNGTDLFVAGGVSGSFATSPDGMTWTIRNNGTGKYFDGMAYGAGRWVAAGSSGTAYYSSNGTSWSSATLPGVDYSKNHKSVVYANGLFVLGGGEGQCFTSPDGVTWTKRTTNLVNHLMGMTWTGNHYVTCGDSNTMGCSMVGASTNGASWVRDRTDKVRTLLGAASSGSNVVCVGIKSQIVFNTTGGVGDGNGCANTPPPPGDTITITSPSSSSNWGPGTVHEITWRGSKKYDRCDIEYYNGKAWVVVVTGTADDGSYSWTVPNTPTSSAQVWIKGWHTGGNATDKSDYFKISGTAPVENTITILYPNGGESLPAGSQQVITWKTTGVITKVDMEYSLDNKKTWKVLVTGTANDGNHVWNVPSTQATQCYLWVKGWGDANGNDTDYSDEAFKIGNGLSITSPNGGENLTAGTTHTITWTSVGPVGNVKLDYSLNNGNSWVNIVAATENDGSFDWTLPATQSSTCLVRVTEVSGAQVTDLSNSAFTIGGKPSLVLDKSNMTFTAIQGGAGASAQALGINNGGGGTLHWTGASNAAWLTMNPTSGTGNGTSNITVNVAGLGIGTYTGVITISDEVAENSPVTVEVTLNVISEGQDQSPFGMLATPTDATGTVSGSIGVTGWALDDMGVDTVKIYRRVDGELSFIGDASFVTGARPDIEAAYPGYPNNNRAGWGYMLLSNFLPDGSLTLVAVAIDTTGHQTELGSATITLDNAHAVKPFGAIDSPGQGATVSGNKYRNNGWALTPLPNKIPTNGSTINVYIDGVARGKATYNLYRADIATLFPGYANSNNAWGYFDIDTTAFANGLHTIQWSVTDDHGNSDGIGSRYFNITNSSRSSAAASASDETSEPVVFQQPQSKNRFHAQTAEMVGVKTGYAENGVVKQVNRDAKGAWTVQMQELGRVQVALVQQNTKAKHLAGYMLVNGQKRPLPIGSTLDANTGIFYWQAGPGFVGSYELVFFITENGRTSEKKVNLEILPGSGK